MTEGLQKKTKILDAERIGRMVDRMAHEIAERHKDLPDLAFIGIRTRGVPLAVRLAAKLAELVKQPFPVGTLDITLYRDDLSMVAPQPVLKKTEIPFPVEDTNVILCDDVLYTGRTVRAAMDAILDFGRPRKILLAVLVDRGRRELPIEAQYIGKKIATSTTEIVSVTFKETDPEDDVWLLDRDGARPASRRTAKGGARAAASGRKRPRKKP